MSERDRFSLRAAALPRIGPGVRSPRGGRPQHPPPQLPHHLVEALLRRLDTGSRAALPFSLGPEGEWRLWLGQVLISSALAWGVLVWLGQSWVWAIGVATLAIAFRSAALLRHQEARRRAMALRSRLREEGHVADLETELLSYIKLAPEDPAARYLLALARVERARPLEALLQLATLRDRYPSAGEVVLLAAIACAQLNRPGRAGRLLSALTMDPAHPWWHDVVEFAHACGSAGPSWPGDIAESGTPG